MYPIRTAVEDASCPTMTADLVGATTPAIPTTIFGANDGHPMPMYRSNYFDDDSGLSGSEEQSMWGAGIFARPYSNGSTLVGMSIMGVDNSGGYKLKTLGVTNTTALDPFYWGGYVHGVAIAIRDTTIAGSQVTFSYLRQQVGDFTGGASTTALGTLETVTVDFGYPVSLLIVHGMGPAIHSTEADPVVNVYLQAAAAPGDDPTYEGERIACLRIPLTGTPTLRGVFWTDADADTPTINSIIGTTVHNGNSYILWYHGSPAATLCLTIAQGEPAWPALPTYTNYVLEIDSPELPADLVDTFAFNATWSLTNITCSPSGWALSLKFNNAGAVTSRFYSIDPDWQEYREIAFTGADATADGVIAQGDSTVLNETDTYTGLVLDGSYNALLLGGTNAVPAFGYGPATCDSGEVVEPVVDEDIRLRVWPFALDDHQFYVLRLGANATLVYDLTTGQWAEWQSPDRDNWRAHVGQNWVGMSATTIANGFGSDVVAGDDTTGQLWILDPVAGQDDNVTTGVAEPFDRIVTGGIPLDGREVAKCNAVTLNLSLGNPALTAATITLETSDDMGQSWADHGAVTIAAGDYSAVVEWRSLGLMRAPGRVFRITDNGAAVRISAADLR